MGKYSVRDWFREDIRHDSPEEVALWRTWFSDHGIDPDEVLLDQWVERRANPGQNQIVYLVESERDGAPIVAQKVKDLDEPPAEFPVA